MRVIFWAGDSTCKTNKYDTWPQTGIAQAFDRYTASDVVLYNHAENGRSTKSFIDEGRLDRIASELREGDFLFIQFGHNDEKVQDEARYTDPQGAFTDNLKKFADTAAARGAHPLFITPVERRLFTEEGVLRESGHAPYAAATIEAGRRFGVPVVDLWTKSRAFLTEKGDEASRRFYMITVPGEFAGAPDGQVDNSHLKCHGAMLYAGMIAEELAKLPPLYASLLAEDELLTIGRSIEAGG